MTLLVTEKTFMWNKAKAIIKIKNTGEFIVFIVFNMLALTVFLKTCFQVADKQNKSCKPNTPNLAETTNYISKQMNVV